MIHTDHIVDWTINTLFPCYCAGCGAEDQTLCANCIEQIVLIKHQQCVRCNKITPEGKTCSACKRYTPLHQLLAAAHYDEGPLKEALHTFKYHGRLDLGQTLAQLVYANPDTRDALTSLHSTSLLTTTVPLHRRRLWQRGFNQSTMLAHCLTDQLGIQAPQLLLKRTRFTHTQIALHKKDRAKNVLGAFVVIKPEQVMGKTIVVIDDIATTGATLSACAYALKQAGAKRIIGLVIARAR